MRFKTPKRLWKKYEKLNDEEKRRARSHPSNASGREVIGREQQFEKANSVDAGLEQPREKELLPTTEVSDDGTRNNSSGKDSTRIGRIKRRFQRR